MFESTAGSELSENVDSIGFLNCVLYILCFLLMFKDHVQGGRVHSQENQCPCVEHPDSIRCYGKSLVCHQAVGNLSLRFLRASCEPWAGQLPVEWNNWFSSKCYFVWAYLSEFLFAFFVVWYTSKSWWNVPEADINTFRFREDHMKHIRSVFYLLHQITVVIKINV